MLSTRWPKAVATVNRLPVKGRTLNLNPRDGTSCLFSVRQSITSEKAKLSGFAFTGAQSAVS